MSRGGIHELVDAGERVTTFRAHFFEVSKVDAHLPFTR